MEDMAYCMPGQHPTTELYMLKPPEINPYYRREGQSLLFLQIMKYYYHNFYFHKTKFQSLPKEINPSLWPIPDKMMEENGFPSGAPALTVENTRLWWRSI